MNHNHVLIIAEAGVNHNNDLDTALRLCDAAKASGADVVKFQTWITERIITRTVAQADYQAANTGVSESQFDMLKKLELSFENFRKVKAHCDEIGITFASTADDFESLDFVTGELKVPFIKVSSGDIGNVEFLRRIGTKKLPVILSTGMSTLADVELSVNALKSGGATDITLLHCTTNYPCPHEDVNLKAMLTLKDVFGLPAGYSDHTIGPEVSLAAVAMGATVIEKHFTLDKNMEGPDHLASTEPAQFKEMCDMIRHLEAAMGTGQKVPSAAEREIAKVVTKRLVADRQIKKGEVLTADNVTIKRGDNGVRARDWDSYIGTAASRDFDIDEGIE